MTNLQNDQIIANEDFEGDANGWSNTTVRTLTDGTSVLARSADRRTEGPQTEKTFDVPAGAAAVTISFDFFEFDSWDGETFDIYVNDEKISIDFNWRTDENARSDETNGVRWSVDPVQGADENLGGDGSARWSNDEIHRISLTIDNPGEALKLGFGDSLNQNARDESWGVDNLEIIARANGAGTGATPSLETFDAAPIGWTNATTARGVDEATQYLTRTGDGVVEKTFAIAPGAAAATVAFDFYEIDSWDGETFDIYLNGRKVSLDFNWRDAEGVRRGETDGVSWSVEQIDAGTANFAQNSGARWSNDEIHRITLTIAEPGDSLTVGFGDTLDQSANDESWGVDNLEVIALDEYAPLSAENGVQTFDGPIVGWKNGVATGDDVEAPSLLRRVEDGRVEKAFELGPDALEATVAFDFYEIDSWDGETFDIFVNGEKISLDFSWRDNEAARSGETNGVSWSVEQVKAATENLVGNSTASWSNDEIHRITLTVADPGETLTLGFDDTLDQNADDESWGVDNLSIEVRSEPALIAQSGVWRLDVTNGQEGPDAWYRVEFAEAMIDPVVVMSPPSSFGDEPAVMRVRNVTETGFEYQVDEFDYNDGFHNFERGWWAAVERGVHELADGGVIEAGTGLLSDGGESFDFEADFGDVKPAVIGQITSDNDTAAVFDRFTDVTPDGFSAKLQEEEAADQIHADEAFDYIAFGRGVFDDYRTNVEEGFEARIRFGGGYDLREPFEDNEAAFAEVQSNNGEDPYTVRFTFVGDDVSGEQIGIFVGREEQSLDEETFHEEVEDFAWVVMDDAIFN